MLPKDLQKFQLIPTTRNNDTVVCHKLLHCPSSCQRTSECQLWSMFLACCCLDCSVLCLASSTGSAFWNDANFSHCDHCSFGHAVLATTVRASSTVLVLDDVKCRALFPNCFLLLSLDLLFDLWVDQRPQDVDET